MDTAKEQHSIGAKSGLWETNLSPLGKLYSLPLPGLKMPGMNGLVWQCLLSASFGILKGSLQQLLPGGQCLSCAAGASLSHRGSPFVAQATGDQTRLAVSNRGSFCRFWLFQPGVWNKKYYGCPFCLFPSAVQAHIIRISQGCAEAGGKIPIDFKRA